MSNAHCKLMAKSDPDCKLVLREVMSLSLLDLPQELQDNIYRKYFEGTHIEVRRHKSGTPRRQPESGIVVENPLFVFLKLDLVSTSSATKSTRMSNGSGMECKIRPSSSRVGVIPKPCSTQVAMPGFTSQFYISSIRVSPPIP